MFPHQLFSSIRWRNNYIPFVSLIMLCLHLPIESRTSASIIVSIDQMENVLEGGRKLQNGVGITDGTSNFVASTESIYDHMVRIEGTDNLSFHWNDIIDNQVTGRLIHKADTIQQAPTWLGLGVYHSNSNYTTLPGSESNYMIGSYAMVGLVEQAETPTPAKHYLLADKMVDSIQETTDTSIVSATIFQHDSDDGTVITELTFTKKLEPSDTTSSMLRKDGANVLLWAVGSPGGTMGVLSKHSLKGVLLVDFQKVQSQVEGSSTETSNTSTDIGTESVVDTTSESGNNTGTNSISNGASGSGTAVSDPNAGTPTTPSQAASDQPNIARIVGVQCTSTILGDGPGIGQVALTPTTTFFFRVMGDKIQLALQHAGSHPVWLGIASSTNGYMIGSSAVIGSPGDGNDSISTPRSYTLMDKSQSGMQENSLVELENASIESSESSNDSSQQITTLTYTKRISDPNDSNSILKDGKDTVATFLFAVGESRQLAYHEHRGQFKIDLSQCGGEIATSGGTDEVVWTSHGIFAVHGFLAALAWVFLSPFAVTVAWFRTLVPASWIYIHVFSNVFTVLLTVIAFFLAIGGVAKQDGADHYTKTHHWVGTVLLVLAAFQVINGFLRPPVDRKDPPSGAVGNGGIPRTINAFPPQEVIFGILPIPRTPREAWHTIHRMTGLAALAMGIYQIQSGLKLYAMRFQTTSIVNYYWMYVGVFVISLIALKLYVIREEDKARRGVLQAVSTMDPDSDEEPHDDNGGMSHTMA